MKEDAEIDISIRRSKCGWVAIVEEDDYRIEIESDSAYFDKIARIIRAIVQRNDDIVL